MAKVAKQRHSVVETWHLKVASEFELEVCYIFTALFIPSQKFVCCKLKKERAMTTSSAITTIQSPKIVKNSAIAVVEETQTTSSHIWNVGKLASGFQVRLLQI